MKLAEFNRFCWRQWEDRGTAESVRLPAADLRELTEEFLGTNSEEADIATWATGKVACGARLASMVNPAAKTPVTIDLAPDGEPATAVVRYGPTGTARTVPVR